MLFVDNATLTHLLENHLLLLLRLELVIAEDLLGVLLKHRRELSVNVAHNNHSKRER